MNSSYPAKGGLMSDAIAREMFNAIEAGNIERVRALVSAEPSLIGAIVDNADPLGWAAFYGHPDIVEYFIQAGSDLNWRTLRGTSPLGFAIKGAEGAFKSHGVDRPTDLYEQCVALLKAAGASE
jgi:ankyrin repeat protein